MEVVDSVTRSDDDFGPESVVNITTSRHGGQGWFYQ